MGGFWCRVTRSSFTHVGFSESDRGAIQWGFCRVRFQDFKVLGLMQLWAGDQRPENQCFPSSADALSLGGKIAYSRRFVL